MLREPPSLNPKCGSCGLYRGCNSPKMQPSGKGRRRILVVAEAPGKDEDARGIQLVGRSGKKFEEVLAAHGVDMRKDCWLTNSLICHPPDNKIEDERMIDYCRPNLVKTIERLNPEIIITLGGVAVKSLISYLWKEKNVGGVSRWAGYQIPSQKLNAWVCPTFHPSHIVRQEGEKGYTGVEEILFNRHIRDAVKLRERPWEGVPDFEKMVEPIYNPLEAARLVAKIKDGVIAFDYETNMLKPDSGKAEIVTCSVCHNGKKTFAFPWVGPVRTVMKLLLTNPAVKKIASNAKFEHRWTAAKLGVEVRGWMWDTMLAAHNLENAGKVRKISSLKFQAFVHLGQSDYDTHVKQYLKGDRDDGNAANKIKKIGLRQLLIYNGMDSLLEYLVAMKYQINKTGGQT